MRKTQSDFILAYGSKRKESACASWKCIGARRTVVLHSGATVVPVPQSWTVARTREEGAAARMTSLSGPDVHAVRGLSQRAKNSNLVFHVQSCLRRSPCSAAVGAASPSYSRLTGGRGGTSAGRSGLIERPGWPVGTGVGVGSLGFLRGVYTLGSPRLATP